MSNNTKKAAGVVGGLTAVAAAAAIALSGGGPDGTAMEIPYTIEEREYTSVMTVTPPEEETVDIVTLYCNNVEVDKALLPNESLQSIPVVFTDKERLQLRMYRRGEQVGVAEFKGDVLYYREEREHD